ncbi:MAG: iron-sulfur cluster assembly scaffold protein [Gammaproteobacteria bacterium]|nr:iron-sulfur cluster assembly scaffold protein [Gammaproteobacteria bacterium]QOJ31111.1 MAG: iron-sulfur cluster assembly scaffold protein [Gammaproteobacteria bacterium]
MRHSPLVQEHFDNPRRLGPPQGPGPVACGRAGSAAEGARILIEARIVAGRIEEITFRALGCPWVIAACSLAVDRLAGAPAAALAAFDPGALAAELDLPAERLGRLLILQDALRNCLADWDTTQPATAK